MKMPENFDEDMIAPCGINCLACNAYLNGKTKCPGCRAPLDKISRKTVRECPIKKCAFEKGLKWCFEDMGYPCPKIKALSRRYLKNYSVDIIENAKGARWDIPAYLKAQQELFTCKSCGGIINQHRKTCSDCGKEKDLLKQIFENIKKRDGIFLLTMNDYNDRKHLIKKLEAAYGNEHIFEFAMLKLLEQHENKASAFGLYFGFHKEPINFTEIGKILNLSPNRAGKLCNAAFRRLIAPGFYKKIWDEYGYKEKE